MAQSHYTYPKAPPLANTPRAPQRGVMAWRRTSTHHHTRNTVRLIHTSDWHLGHKLHNQSRHDEHVAFLDWLVEQIVTHDVDALLIAGDVFDTPNPPAESVKLLYDFFHKLHSTSPRLQTVIIGGNHDSAQRLEAPQLILSALNIHIIGALYPQEPLDLDRTLIPLTNKRGERAAWVVAIPYLRPSDLPNLTPRPENHLVEGVREVYRLALERVSARRGAGEGVVVMGHCFMVSGTVSEDSERRILGNHQHALPLDLFPMDVSYVALGHLHYAQALKGVEKIRYAGSPIPLSLTERNYKHQVALVELEDEGSGAGPRGSFKSVTPLYIPRLVEMIRIPEAGGVSSEEALKALSDLPERDESVPLWRRPFLHVCVHLSSPDPQLKAKVFEVLKGKHARLSRLQVTMTTGTSRPEERLQTLHLSEIKEVDVFKRLWERKYDAPLPDEALEAFQVLLNEVLESEGEA